MAELAFKLVANTGDWGSPLSSLPAFDSLEEARAAAREYLAEQRQAGGPGSPLRITVEETRADGTVVEHPVG
jgi:hypothetical protein